MGNLSIINTTKTLNSIQEYINNGSKGYLYRDNNGDIVYKKNKLSVFASLVVLVIKGKGTKNTCLIKSDKVDSIVMEIILNTKQKVVNKYKRKGFKQIVDLEENLKNKELMSSCRKLYRIVNKLKSKNLSAKQMEVEVESNNLRAVVENGNKIREALLVINGASNKNSLMDGVKEEDRYKTIKKYTSALKVLNGLKDTKSYKSLVLENRSNVYDKSNSTTTAEKNINLLKNELEDIVIKEKDKLLKEIKEFIDDDTANINKISKNIDKLNNLKDSIEYFDADMSSVEEIKNGLRLKIEKLKKEKDNRNNDIDSIKTESKNILSTKNKGIEHKKLLLKKIKPKASKFKNNSEFNEMYIEESEKLENSIKNTDKEIKRLDQEYIRLKNELKEQKNLIDSYNKLAKDYLDNNKAKSLKMKIVHIEIKKGLKGNLTTEIIDSLTKVVSKSNNTDINERIKINNAGIKAKKAIEKKEKGNFKKKIENTRERVVSLMEFNQKKEMELDKLKNKKSSHDEDFEEFKKTIDINLDGLIILNKNKIKKLESNNIKSDEQIGRAKNILVKLDNLDS